MLLRLVVVHGLNGHKFEKFYIICSALMALILVVPPYALGQYGCDIPIFFKTYLVLIQSPNVSWDPLFEDCWYTNSNLGARIAWQVC